MIQSSSKALIVEFIGTPGAGKTTCLPAVKEFFAAQGFQTWSVLEASRPFAQRTRFGQWVNSWAPASLKSLFLWQVFYQSSKLRRMSFRSENKELINSILRFQRKRPISSTDRHHVLHWFINLTGQYHFLKEHAQDNDILIFDEGFVHRVVQLFASEVETLDEVRIQSYLSLIPVPDLIISPHASLETCFERVYRRGIWKRYKDRDLANVFRFMSNAHEAVSIALDYMRARGWPVIQVNNESLPPVEVAFQLKQQLTQQYSLSAPQDTIPIRA
jgi:hypothetical protein